MDIREKLKAVLTEKELEELLKIIEAADEKTREENIKWIVDMSIDLSVLLYGLYSSLMFHPDIEKKLISKMKEGVAKQFATKTFELSKEYDRLAKKS